MHCGRPRPTRSQHATTVSARRSPPDVGGGDCGEWRHESKIALLVDQKQFDQLIEQSFPKEVAKVRARGIDPLRMTMGDAQTAAEKILANAVETGILKRNKVAPRLSDVRDKLESIAGKGVDLSIVKRGGKFDHGPYFPIP